MNKQYDFAKQPGKPWAVFDKATGDVLCYIPNGKTQITQLEEECDACNANDAETAEKIALLMTEASKPKKAQKPRLNSCGHPIEPKQK
jgi:hypothetical protein